MSSANIVAIKLSTNPHIDGRSIDTLIALLIVCLIQILWLAIIAATYHHIYKKIDTLLRLLKPKVDAMFSIKASRIWRFTICLQLNETHMTNASELFILKSHLIQKKMKAWFYQKNVYT